MTMMTDIALSVSSVTRSYHQRPAVADASFDLRTGQIACLLGPSGCGKSTLLRLIAGLEPVDSGTIAIGGLAVSTPAGTVPPEKRGVGLVFQDFALFPHLSVAGNIGFGLKHLEASARRARVQTLLESFHIERLADAWPHTLSGGEQQRVAIARALAREPAVLLLDEPFSGLDGHLRAAIRQSVLADLRAAGATVLIVTHDPEEAMSVADHLMLMSNGRILQTGRPEDCYLRPESIEAGQLLGEVIVLPAHVIDGWARTPFGSVPAPGHPSGPVSVMLRPEALSIGAVGTVGGATATVIDAGFGGAFHKITLSAGGIVVTTRTTDPPPSIGSSTCVSIDPSRAGLFPMELSRARIEVSSGDVDERDCRQAGVRPALPCSAGDG